MRSIGIFVLLLLIGWVSADTISDVNLAVGGDGFVQVEERVIFEEEGILGVLELPHYASEFTVSDSQETLNYTVTEVDGVKTAKIQFNEYLEAGKTKEVWVRYGTDRLTAKDEGVWTVSIDTPSTPRKTIIRLTLPPDAKVLELSPASLLRTYVKDGVWVYPQEGRLNFSISYKSGGVKPEVNVTTVTSGTIQELPIVDGRTFYGLILGIVVLLVVVIIYSMYRNRLLLTRKGDEPMTVNVGENIVSEPKVGGGKVSYDIKSVDHPGGVRTVKESVLKMLDDTELSIVRLLEEGDEEGVTQAYIHKTTNIPKSSLSDILRQIEKRNIIERKQEGRVKWIKLKEWVLE
ncbi:MAG: hypothetical protein V1744_06205 [Candidatus Altiarchaeota archaeon]